MRLRLDRRRWTLAGASVLAVLALLAVTAVARAALSPRPVTVAADPSPTSSPSASPSPTPFPSPATVSPSPDLATPHPLPTVGPGDPVPQQRPGRKRTEFMFVNNDPEFDVVFYIGDTRYGPFTPWTRSSFYAHETYAGLVFRMEFPRRHNCDYRNYPLEGPIEGRWAILAERVFQSRGCASMGVSGADPISAVPGSDPWTFDPEPTPTKPATEKPTSSPAPTPTPTSSPTPAVSPSPSATPPS